MFLRKIDRDKRKLRIGSTKENDRFDLECSARKTMYFDLQHKLLLNLIIKM